MTVAALAHDLTLTAIDLTRACAAHELYHHWLSRHSAALGSAGIANYLLNAALAFEEQAHPQLPSAFDPFVARENLSDLLMTSPPLSCAQLQAAVTAAIQEARLDRIPAFPFSRAHHDEDYFAAIATRDDQNGYVRNGGRAAR
jgi:hypothetical protein